MATRVEVWAVPGLRLQARHWGVLDGGAPVALFLHGFAGTSEVWEPVVAPLLAGWHCIAVDLPGHGGSEWPDDVPTLQGVAKVLTDCLSVRGVQAVTVVGYSLGARLALQLALTSPERVRHLMLIATSPGLAAADARVQRLVQDARWADVLRGQGMAPFLAEWDQQALFNGGRSLPVSRRDWWSSLRKSQNPHTLAEAIVAFSPGREPFVGARLAGCPIPTELVVGGSDTRYVDWGHWMARQMPDSRLHILDGVAHNVPLEAAEALAELLVRTLDKKEVKS